MAENFPIMGKEIATQLQEAQRVPYRINPKKNTPRHIHSSKVSILRRSTFFIVQLSQPYMTTGKNQSFQ